VDEPSGRDRASGPRRAGPDVARLLALLARLRDPRTGCPWAREQSFESLAPYTVEEAFEVEDAVARGDRAALREELGDLLLQVVYHARVAEEEGAFDFADVVETLCEKLVDRHPHVFGDAEAEGAEEVARQWEARKRAERRRAARERGLPPGVADDVPASLPALARAQKLLRRGREVAPAADEAAREARAALDALAGGAERAASRASAEEAAGRLLFAAVRLAAGHGADAEAALRAANRRFEAELRRPGDAG